MVEGLRQDDIRARTIASIQNRYQLDTAYGEQVATLAAKLLAQCGGEEWISEPQAEMLLSSVAQLHEIGLSIDYKKAANTVLICSSILSCQATPARRSIFSRNWHVAIVNN